MYFGGAVLRGRTRPDEARSGTQAGRLASGQLPYELSVTAQPSRIRCAGLRLS
jgi:hypothetical protein